tara:strand:+ start:37 stop:435 length:399 start_codon:yes stop_codon:yes gene_type:complete
MTGNNIAAQTQAQNYYSKVEQELTDTVSEMEEALEEWEDKAKAYYKEKTNLEAWEASTKRALMISGKSGIAAEAVMKCDGEVQTGIGSKWAHKTHELNNAMIEERVAHKRLRIAEMKWETERSKAATLRTLV